MKELEVKLNTNSYKIYIEDGLLNHLSFYIKQVYTNKKIYIITDDNVKKLYLDKVINSLKGKITIILTTHYMEEAESLSDRIGIMANGNLIDIGTSEELIKKTKTKNFEDAFVSIATGGEL